MRDHQEVSPQLRMVQSNPNLRPLSIQDTSTKKPLYHSRTQHKQLLQRQSFLADDTNSLDHPVNMRRLTKELERVNREYRCVKHFVDPFAESIKRILVQHSPST